ncbi:sugar phosphate isomerase/epimerase [Rhodobacter sp. JA431]|uniref:sugar phosphate isomerase/epimerase family protein n=1 Tax=Rhodobacter sp. JA431 TaxID=570013 RepID=UPI000BD77097|nr:sugar phosphate isomerase/epimerase family protein [Rhodobacter sp. JA431]SOC00464.1 sugar phosphate isomerase/epimerase [Rhodobacter sp. JA431]
MTATPLPLLGTALLIDHFTPLRDWICEAGRAIEIQDFVTPNMSEAETAELIAQWQKLLPAHTGPRGIHGPFLGLDLSTADKEIRALVTKRLLWGVNVAEALSATHMVVHSPFTYWHLLNRANYPFIEPAMFDAMADCLAPVLARAADVGCTVMLENIDDTDPTARVRLVQQINHPNLRVSIDTGHAELAHGRYGAPPVVDYIAAAGATLGHVHLQDADGYADRHWHPGDGRIPWRPVFEALAKLETPPRLILEVREDRTRLPQTVARLEALGLAR